MDDCYARLRAQGRKAVIPYITAGDPFVDATVDILHALVDGGADILEIGVPFSDPMADGPVIQRASERALARGVSLDDVIGMVREFRGRDTRTPVVLMGYANPIEHYDLVRGAGRFVLDAAAAGVDGVLVVDYPPEESQAYTAALKAAGLAPIFLLAPTSTEDRIRTVGQIASGYVYYVSLRGVTGAGHLDTSEVARAVPRIRQHVSVPVGVGFGIRDGATARAVAEVADAVVVGSALVERLQAQPRAQVAQAARAFAAEIRAAVDEVRR
ncbi:MAG TPA: tryptophan synthase subunit alpha [Burkholderiaceae bacterium]|nr:tryptophan synthase subunit alpha [Burkholderiaceae bacterium]